MEDFFLSGIMSYMIINQQLFYLKHVIVSIEPALQPLPGVPMKLLI